ncbi:MAG: YeeE/YedE family protein [Proteobacteria bacterium]|nr:YeeE/YedE family protein [Pseudomonadota bacterium]
MLLVDFVPADSGSLLLLNGRIAGISGILRGFLAEHGAAFRERALFLRGLIAGSTIYARLTGQPPVPRADFPAWRLALAGFLVGLGSGPAFAWPATVTTQERPTSA